MVIDGRGEIRVEFWIRAVIGWRVLAVGSLRFEYANRNENTPFFFNSVHLSTNLSVGLTKTFVHFPDELRSGRTDVFAHFEQVEYVVGREHLGTLAGRRRAGLEFGEHGAGGGRRRWQTAASPEVWPTYLVGYSAGIENRPKTDGFGYYVSNPLLTNTSLSSNRTTWNETKKQPTLNLNRIDREIKSKLSNIAIWTMRCNITTCGFYFARGFQPVFLEPRDEQYVSGRFQRTEHFAPRHATVNFDVQQLLCLHDTMI